MEIWDADSLSARRDPAPPALPEGAWELLEDAARRAGDLLLQFRGRLRSIEYKSEINLVTEADRAAEALIIGAIRERFPAHSILAEESGAHGPGEGAREAGSGPRWRWVIDPLDGTTNFAHSLPIFAVSIALQCGELTVAGAVNAPALGELYLGRLGGGVTLNGAPLRVSPTADLGRSLVVTGFPYDRRQRIAHYMDYFGRALARTQGVLRWGAAAIDLAHVAAGRLEAFWEEKLHPWDTAAGELFVREAGGRVTRFSGGSYSIFDKDILATNGHIHEAMMEILTGAAEANDVT